MKGLNCLCQGCCPPESAHPAAQLSSIATAERRWWVVAIATFLGIGGGAAAAQERRVVTRRCLLVLPLLPTAVLVPLVKQISTCSAGLQQGVQGGGHKQRRCCDRN